MIAIMPSKPTLKRDTRGYWFTQWYEDGKRHTHTFRHESDVPERKARSRFRNWKVSWETGATEDAPTPDALTVKELADLYYDFADEYYRRKTDRTPTGEALKIEYAVGGLVEMFGKLDGNNLEVKHVKAYQGAMIEAGLARTTINMRINIVRRWARWCVAEQGLNPVVSYSIQAIEGLKAGRSDAVEPDPVLPVHESIVVATKKHLPKVLVDMVDLQLLTGMRPEEVCMMRPCDIDISKTPWLYKPRHHKTLHWGHVRHIYLGPKARDIVSRYLARPVHACLFSPIEAVGQRRGKEPKQRVTDSYDTRSYRRAIHYAAAAAEVEVWGPNRLRHNALTAVERAHGGDAARAIGGHRYIETTQRNYVERDMRISRDVAEMVG